MTAGTNLPEVYDPYQEALARRTGEADYSVNGGGTTHTGITVIDVAEAGDATIERVHNARSGLRPDEAACQTMIHSAGLVANAAILAEANANVRRAIQSHNTMPLAELKASDGQLALRGARTTVDEASLFRQAGSELATAGRDFEKAAKDRLRAAKSKGAVHNVNRRIARIEADIAATLDEEGNPTPAIRKGLLDRFVAALETFKNPNA
jgi:hypothetical protein